MITVQNYREATAGMTVPAELQAGHEYTLSYLDLYDKKMSLEEANKLLSQMGIEALPYNVEVSDAIDAHIAALNSAVNGGGKAKSTAKKSKASPEEALEPQAQSPTPDYDKLLHKEKAAKKPKSKKEPKVKADRAPKERKATKTKPADTGGKVDRTDMSAKFVAEFVKMLDKPVGGTRLVSYLKRLQRAIYDLQVRKNSRYANLIVLIQSKLVSLLNGNRNATIDYACTFGHLSAQK